MPPFPHCYCWADFVGFVRLKRTHLSFRFAVDAGAVAAATRESEIGLNDFDGDTAMTARMFSSDEYYCYFVTEEYPGHIDYLKK